MVNKNFWFGILVMVLIFGMTVVGCDDGSTGENTDGSGINGTWVNTYGIKLRLNNGYYEEFRNNIPSYRANYTTKDGIITLKVTSVYGGTISSKLESKWYSIDELETLLDKQKFPYIFNETNYSYSVSGNTLKISIETYTRK